MFVGRAFAHGESSPLGEAFLLTVGAFLLAVKKLVRLQSLKALPY